MRDSHNSSLPGEEEKILRTPAFDEAFSAYSSDPPKFLDKILAESINLSSSDILFEPREEYVEVRLRIDGVLYEIGKINQDAYLQLTSRIKVLSSLDPTEKRKVQEGQYAIRDYQGVIVNLRVEIAQTTSGELIVIRVHKKETIVMSVTELGFSKVALENFQNMLKKRSGLILVCGPTGCGKTTTLYSTIAKLNESEEYNVM